MFGIGVPELILILIIGLVVFGPGKLPEVGRAVGKGLREFRKASSALTASMNEPEPARPQPPQTIIVTQPATVETAPGNAAPVTLAKAADQPTAPPYTAPTQESVRAALATQEKKA
ncbi:MAG: twin-arginine translocase TatA/TatE family subunit [Selenomonadaceae bacterium]|nr:twin-arginine translocase TatA/TatE family subunit [Selenomonadaceae bacterium]